MRLTKVDINIAVRADRNFVAYVNVVFDSEFKVRGLRVVRRPDETLLLLMPSMPTKAGDFKDVCHPITPDLRQHIESVVLQRVGEMLKGSGGPPAPRR